MSIPSWDILQVVRMYVERHSRLAPIVNELVLTEDYERAGNFTFRICVDGDDPILYWNNSSKSQLSLPGMLGRLHLAIRHLIGGHEELYADDRFPNRDVLARACAITAAERCPYPLPKGHPAFRATKLFPPDETAEQRYFRILGLHAEADALTLEPNNQDVTDTDYFADSPTSTPGGLPSAYTIEDDDDDDEQDLVESRVIDAHQGTASPSLVEISEKARRKRQSLLRSTLLDRKSVAHAEDVDFDLIMRAITGRPASLDGLDAMPGPNHGSKSSDRIILVQDPNPQQMPWKNILQALCMLRPERRLSLNWPSRRMPEWIGVVGGRRRRYIPPRRPNILLAVDTSGSMQPSVLSWAAGAMQTLSSHANLLIIDLDSEIKQVRRYQKTIESFTGGGGTDLRPAFSRDIIRKHAIDGLLFVTDGDGLYPDYTPEIPVCWLMPSWGYIVVPWGLQVVLPVPEPRWGGGFCSNSGD